MPGSPAPSPQITVDTSNFVAGGWVSVTVTCVTSLADVSVPGVPGAKTLIGHVDRPTSTRTGRCHERHVP